MLGVVEYYIHTVPNLLFLFDTFMATSYY